MIMCKDKYVELELEDGTTVQYSIYDIILFESKKYALLTIEDSEDGNTALLRFEEKGDEYFFLQFMTRMNSNVFANILKKQDLKRHDFMTSLIQKITNKALMIPGI